MQNAHERFGTLEFTKRVKDTTTRVRVHMDRLIVEAAKEEHRSAGVHLLSVMGSDAEIAALWAGVTEGALFQIQIPGRSVFTGSLGPEAQCFRGSVAVAGQEPSGPALGGCVGRVSQDETWCRPGGRTDHSVR